MVVQIQKDQGLGQGTDMETRLDVTQEILLQKLVQSTNRMEGVGAGESKMTHIYSNSFKSAG